MKVYLARDHLPILKRYLRGALPATSATVRLEAAARGLRFSTNGGFRRAVLSNKIVADFDESAFSRFLNEHGASPQFRALQRTVIRTILEPIIDDNKQLSSFGFGVPILHYPGESYANLMARSREEFFTDAASDAFELALVLLQNVERRSTLNRVSDTYRLKRLAEGMSRQSGRCAELSDYVPHGVLIAAAIYEGFHVRRVKRLSPCAHLNISEKSLKRFRNRR